MRKMRPGASKLAQWLRRLPEEDEGRREFLEHILSGRTLCFTMDNHSAARMIEDARPAGERERADARWPTRNPMYVEYDPPLILDPMPGDGGTEERVRGMVIIPQGETARVLHAATRGNALTKIEHETDISRGTTTVPGGTRGREEAMETGRMNRFYVRLAALMRRTTRR